MAVSLVLSAFVIASPTLVDADLDYPVRVLFSTRRTHPVIVSEAVWEALQTGRLNELPHVTIEHLFNAGIVVDETIDEIVDVLTDNVTAIQTSRQLYHVVQPTASCQLGCGYCGQSHFPRLLTPGDQDALVGRLSSRLESGQYERLTVSWFGAEPLLGLSVIRSLSSRFREIAARYDATYNAKIVTNGVRLTASVAHELERLDVHEAEVTLDGLGPVHDRSRPFKGGRGSFDTIVRNLIAIRDRTDITLRLVIRCNVDRANAPHVGALIDHLADIGLQRRVAFYTSPVYSWGNDADQAALSLKDYSSLEVEWLAQQVNRGFTPGLLPGRKPIVCLAVQRHGELTDATGSVFNCTEVSYVPSYGTPNVYVIGRVGTTQLAAPAPFRTWNDEIERGDQAPCRSCAMLPACGGSCPKLWREGKVPCPSFKENLGERLAVWYAVEKSRAR